MLRVWSGHVAQVVKEAFRSGLVAFAVHTVEAVEMCSLVYAVDVELWDFDVLFHGLPLSLRGELYREEVNCHGCQVKTDMPTTVLRQANLAVLHLSLPGFTL